MDMGEGGGHASSGPSSGVISSMQGHGGGGGGGGAPGTELSFGVEGNIIAGLDGQDPKGGTPMSILTFGLNSVMGIKFDFGLFETTQCISGGFGLPTGPSVIGVPHLGFGLNAASKGKG